MRERLLPVAALTLAAACSTGSGFAQPAVSAFTAGTCRVVAPDVLQIGRIGHRLGSGPEVGAAAVAKLTSAQDGLRQVAAGAEPALQPALSNLVVAVGLVRLQARLGSYHRAQGDNLMARYRDAVRVCTGHAS